MRFSVVLLTAAGILALTGCGETPPGPVPVVTHISTDGLVEEALSAIPAGAFDSVSVLALDNSISEHPLWAVHSIGMLDWDLDPLVKHFLAVYTWSDSCWIQLDRMILGDQYQSPDYLYSGGVTQASLTDDFIWIAIDGAVGAHSGTFQLLSFDCERLANRYSGSTSTPGFAHLENLPADTLNDLVLDYSDAYVFFYASGVRKTDIRVMRRDALDLEMVEMLLQRLPGTAPDEIVQAVDRAVDLADAGLLLQAFETIDAVYPAAPELDERDAWIVNWDYVIISQNYGAAEGAAEYGYPLLSYVFYGDYRSAMEIVTQYTPEQVFSQSSPLIKGTVADGWESELSAELIGSSESALDVQPDLASAWFFRAWGTWLADTDSPAAVEYLTEALILSPEDQFFSSCLEYLGSQ